MRQLMMVLASSAVLLGLVVWDDGQGRHVPTWLYLLAAAPLAWVHIFGWKREEESPARKGLGILYLFGAGVFLMLVGLVGGAMGETWKEILTPALPFGAVVFLLGLLAIGFRR